MNFIQEGGKNFIKVLSIIVSMTVASFIDFETSLGVLFKDKASKNAPKHKIVL